MLTKVEIDDVTLARLLEPLGTATSFELLTGGMFATAYRATFSDGTRRVVKIVGSDTSRLLTYERGLLGTEALTYDMLAGTTIPVPRVEHTDFSRTVIDADVVVASHLPGEVWGTLTLDDATSTAARAGLGAVMARLHELRAPRFGYPAPESGLSAASWREAFTLMVEAILDDAARWDVDVPTERVRAALATHGASLEAVARPAVVHTDLWPGNVFLELEPGTARIVGVIDTERTVWGDPLLDVVGADQFGTGGADPVLVQGNEAAGGVLAAELASASGPTRLAFYRLYYALILLIEAPIRGYQGDWVEQHVSGARANLEAALGSLGV